VSERKSVCSEETVFVIDAGGKIVYRQLVGEITEPPDYEAALRAAREQA